MHDPFVGTWKLNPGKSQFDPSHRPSAATMRWQLEPDGAYLLQAEGLDEKGEPRAEEPQKLFPDGQPYPVAHLPGLSCIASRSDRNVLHAQVKRKDSIAGEGRYVIAEDGKSMTATTAGFDSQLRRFEMQTNWDRA
jgi:hypothetical protein